MKTTLLTLAIFLGLASYSQPFFELKAGLNADAATLNGALVADVNTYLLESKLGQRLRIGATGGWYAGSSTHLGVYAGYQGYGFVPYIGVARSYPLPAIKQYMQPSMQLMLGFKTHTHNPGKQLDHVFEVRYMANFRQNIHGISVLIAGLNWNARK